MADGGAALGRTASPPQFRSSGFRSRWPSMSCASCGFSKATWWSWSANGERLRNSLPSRTISCLRILLSGFAADRPGGEPSPSRMIISIVPRSRRLGGHRRRPRRTALSRCAPNVMAVRMTWGEPTRRTTQHRFPLAPPGDSLQTFRPWALSGPVPEIPTGPLPPGPRTHDQLRGSRRRSRDSAT